MTEVSSERFITKPLAIIFVTVVIDLIGFGIVIPVLPFYVEGDAFHATPLELGLLFASYSIMQFIFSPILGGISDRYGRRPVLFFSLLGTALGFFILGFATTLWMVFAGRILDGITGGNISTAQAYIADVTSKENRGKGMALIGAAFGIGFVLGPALGGVLSKFGSGVPFIFAGCLAFLNAIALYFFLPESVKPGRMIEKSGNRIAQWANAFSRRDFGAVSAIYFLLVVAFSIMMYGFVLYTASVFGYNAEQNGYLFAFVGVVSIIGQGFLFGHLVKRLGEGVLAMAGCFLMAASLFVVPLVGPLSGGLIALLIGSAALAIGNSLATPSLLGFASKVSHDHEQGKSLGLLQSGASLARAIGPTIGGFLLNNAAGSLDSFTIHRTFWTASGIMLVAFFTAVYFLRTVRTDVVVAS